MINEHKETLCDSFLISNEKIVARKVKALILWTISPKFFFYFSFVMTFALLKS